MGRATSGVTGMKFRDGDQMLSMSVIRAEQVAAEESGTAEVEQYVFTITDGGFAKRTRISEYRLQSRGGIGIKAMKQDDDRGNLVGAFIVVEGDEVLAIKQSGQVTRSAIDEHLRPTGRDTKGVKFVGVNGGDGVAVVARSVERAPEIEEAVEAAVEGGDGVPATRDVNDPGSDATIEDEAALTDPFSAPEDPADIAPTHAIEGTEDDVDTENEES
jgi:DNA gyrase subunit A